MNADTVHIVAQALSPEELQRLYLLIQKEIGIGEVKVVAKKTRRPIISDAKSMEMVSKSLEQAKNTRFNR